MPLSLPRTRPRPRAVVVLVGWTLFVWTTRLGNIWRDDTTTTSAKVGSTALALSFTVLALVVAATLWRRAWTALRLAVVGLAVWTAAVWAVRSLVIMTDDRGVGFKVVHGVLAVVSIALAAWAVSALQARDRDAGGGRPVETTTTQVSVG
jgi:hypothetical protein